MKRNKIIKLTTSIGAIAAVGGGTAASISSCSIPTKDASATFITYTISQNNLVAGNSTSTATIVVTKHGEGIDSNQLSLHLTGTNFHEEAHDPVNDTWVISCNTETEGTKEVTITSTQSDIAALTVNVTVNNPLSKFVTAAVTENNLVAGDTTSTAAITVTSHGDIDVDKLTLNVGGTNLLVGTRSGDIFPITCGTAIAGLHNISITSSEDGVDAFNMNVTVEKADELSDLSILSMAEFKTTPTITVANASSVTQEEGLPLNTEPTIISAIQNLLIFLNKNITLGVDYTISNPIGSTQTSLSANTRSNTTITVTATANSRYLVGTKDIPIGVIAVQRNLLTSA
jgi:hypothetical protein